MKNVSKSVKDLIHKILQVEGKRISAEEIFNHSWMLKEGSNEVVFTALGEGEA